MLYMVVEKHTRCVSTPSRRGVWAKEWNGLEPSYKACVRERGCYGVFEAVYGDGDEPDTEYVFKLCHNDDHRQTDAGQYNIFKNRWRA